MVNNNILIYKTYIDSLTLLAPEPRQRGARAHQMSVAPGEHIRVLSMPANDVRRISSGAYIVSRPVG